jgi:DnaD/phage-associated family protein
LFKGFSEAETSTPIPDTFFRQLLTATQDAQELQVILHALWCLGNMEGPVRLLREADFTGVGADPGAGLAKAVARGVLLRVEHASGACFLLNSPRGRQAAEALQAGRLDPAASGAALPPERANIFSLYEQNIGPLTPLIADALRDAEQSYPPEWVVEALDLAVKKNRRNWKYAEAILRRWKEEGHAKKQVGRNAQEDGDRYIEGDYADYIEH